jgi:hypothetical protein
MQSFTKCFGVVTFTKVCLGKLWKKNNKKQAFWTRFVRFKALTTPTNTKQQQNYKMFLLAYLL